MMRLEDDRGLLDRLYERLTEALQQRADPYGAPVTVAEIYQELVPYRSLRAEPGFAMNADYDHALLRLLSGEGARARLEPESARDLIVRELRSRNPNVSIYREYAGCDVWVTPRPLAGGASAVSAFEPEEVPWYAEGTEEEEDTPADEPLAGADDSPGAFTLLELTQEDEIGMSTEPVAPQRQNGSEQAPAREQAGGGRPPADSAQTAAARYAERQSATVDADIGNCVFCDSQLPSGRRVRFCPFCGGDQTMRPCGECGDALDPSWNFCITCGAPATPG